MVTAEYLQSHALFGGVATDDLAMIIPRLQAQTYATGDYVVREGENGSVMYFIRHGTAEVLKTATETQETLCLAVLHEGDTFGEMELVDVQSRSASVRALEPLTILALSSEDLFDIFREHESAFIIILMNIAREISRRLRKMDALVASSLFHRAPDER